MRETLELARPWSALLRRGPTHYTTPVQISERVSRVGGSALLGLFVAVGSLEAIGNYDYFWHLASGRWIVEHRALPETDPFTLASHDRVWINLEWLFQAFLYPAEQILGHTGLTVMLAILVGIGAAALFLYAERRANPGVAMLIVAVAWLGASHRIDVRPETAAIPFVVIFLIITLRKPSWRVTVASSIFTVVWFAVHPSALLAPVIAGLVLVGALADRREGRDEVLMRLGQTAASGCALLINPWGLKGVLAPVELAGLLQREGLVNLEWLPSSPRVFPGLYVIVGVSLIVVMLRKRGESRWARLVVLLFFGALAIRYVRNHAFFYPVLPVLVAPSIGTLRPKWNLLLGGLTAVVVAFGFITQDPGLGIDLRRFPVRTVERLKASGLRGNVYTPDQFGGYLVWALYPERRTLVDGRNELYVEFFRRFERARTNSREWREMFADFDLTIAVEEYRSRDVEVIDALSGERRTAPASTVYYPRDEWALIGFDDASMLFARRDAHPPGLLRRLELGAIVPDALSPEDVSIGGSAAALEDLRIMESSVGSTPRLQKLRELIAEKTVAD